MRSPSFQFYPTDWLSSTRIALMTPAQEGAYIRLLCYAWSDPDCSLPDDDQVLAQLSRLCEGWFNGGSTIIKECFAPHPQKPGRLVNLRLLEERKKQDLWREKSRLGGVKSGKSRTLTVKGGSTTVEANSTALVEPNGNSSSSSPIKKKRSPLTPLQQERFDKFWAMYPARDGKKLGKDEALTYFADLSEADQALILIAVRNFAASRRVRDGFGIKDPARFIRKLRPKSEPWREWIEPETHAHSSQESQTVSFRKPFTEVAL